MELINICDQLEPYGLVDYEIGVWEEEILFCESGSDNSAAAS